MLYKLIRITGILVILTPCLHAQTLPTTCEIQLALSSAPVTSTNSVAFNISNNQGFSRSTILNAGDGPKIIGKLICSPHPYTISATPFTTHLKEHPIGECILKAGAIQLVEEHSSITVVFPNDFICLK